jgi:site-specific DNA recombinase
MKAILYIRVSTTRQEHSPVAQEKRLRAYCILKDYDVAELIVDNGRTGANTNRPGLQRALSSLAEGHVDVLVVAKLDRLTRSIRDLCDLLATCSDQGWTFASVSEELNTGTPMGRFVINIFGAIAQWERETISERTKEVMGSLKEDGRRWCHYAPYGTRWEGMVANPRTGKLEGGYLVLDGAEQDILTSLRQWKAEGLALTQIAGRANAAGYLTRPGTHWTKQTVSKRLRAKKTNVLGEAA